ncbi:ABC transporter substrate-binding protein [Paenibacillus senegalensis]|uniref:ABC transporter substrate-binding protein n=1 Tax=Paenibacillus senegalensis TaxID=1465766 RepID=UPI000289B525|nr:sugar ABC transporter substrate-binding protein [Paenibacillus senegalensis]
MINKKQWIILTLIFALLFTACSSGKPNPGATTNPGGGNEEKPPQSVELTFAYMGEGATYELYKEMFEAYEDNNPHVTIKSQVIAQDFNSAILTRISGGNPPDLFWISNASLPSFASRNALLNLSPYDGNLFNSSDFNENALEGYSYEGNIYGLPADSAPMVLFYNRDLFDEANVEYPQPQMTWDQLLEKAKQMTKAEGNNTTQFGYAQDLSWQFWAPFVWMNGGDILSEDNSQVVINSSENIEAFNWIRDLMNLHKVAPTSTAQKTNPAYQYFVNGDVAMFFGGAWLASTVLREVDFEWDVVTPPVGKETVNTMALGGFAIASNTDHPEEAVKFLSWLSGEEGQRTKFETGFAGLPTVKSLMDTPIAILGFEHPTNKNIQLDQIIQAASYARVAPASMHWDELNTEITNQLQLFWNGEQEAADTLKKIEDKAKSFFK